MVSARDILANITPPTAQLATASAGALSDSIAESMRRARGTADWWYERLAKKIAEFEAKLDPAEEVGARFVAAVGVGVIHIEDVGYWNPDMLIFYGSGEDGRPVEVLQHVSQLSITLTAVPAKEPEPKRIGFVLLDKLKKDD